MELVVAIAVVAGGGCGCSIILKLKHAVYHYIRSGSPYVEK
jgi:hypothetical protein